MYDPKQEYIHEGVDRADRNSQLIDVMSMTSGKYATKARGSDLYVINVLGPRGG